MCSSPATDGRLRFRREFHELYDQGTAVRGRLMVLIFRPNGREDVRWAVVASRKTGGAVCRNRCKRLLREAYRCLRDRIQGAGLDIVLVARPYCRQAHVREVVDDLAGLYKEAGLQTIELQPGTGPSSR